MLGEQLGSGGHPHRVEPRLLLPEVVDQLAAGVRRPHPHEACVVEKVLQDVGLHPPGRVSPEPDTHLRVELLHGLKQADVSLLDEIQCAGDRPAERQGDLHDEREVREDEPAGRFLVVEVAVAARELLFLFPREAGCLADFPDVSAESVVAGNLSRVVSSVRFGLEKFRIGFEDLQWNGRRDVPVRSSFRAQAP